MAELRITPFPKDRRGWFARLVRWFARRRFKRDLRSLDAYEHSMPVVAAMGAFELLVERAATVAHPLRSLAELKTATVVGCAFCMDIGSALARARGVTEAQVRELHQHATSSAFSPIERDVCDYAVAISQTPAVVPDEVFARLRAALGDRGMVELSAVVAWENYRARMNHALGLPEEGFSEGAVCARPARAAMA
jgi:AhpD family alkylhydroperoxidase